MNALPQATAKGRNQSGIIAGKLNGVIAATTPTGWRTSSTSSPLAIPSRFWPFIRWGMAVAASTDSIPRPTSPSASSCVLPMSAVTSAASSSRCSSSTFRSAITRARALLRRHRPPRRLRLARGAYGLLDVLAPDSGMYALSSPVAGSRSSSVESTAALLNSPPA